MAAALVGGMALAVNPPAGTAATTESLSVDLSSVRGTSTGVGQGLLYGVTQDGTQPADRFVTPLHLNAYRGGGHASGSWISDGYQYGAGTKSEVTEAITQAKRLNTLSPSGVQYQFILSDTFGTDGSQPSNTNYPCTNGDCSDWIRFIDAVVGPLQSSGQKFAYDIYNEPDQPSYWPNASVNSTQYFQMWDSAVTEIRRIAPSATIVGPSFSYTPAGRPAQWNTFLAHVKSAGTAPDWITNHDEGNSDDPVTVGQSLASALSSNGLSSRPLSANEYQPLSAQNTGVTAWYLDRFAQSNYTNAMRGNWVSVTGPNLTGLLTNDGLSANGGWWAMRAYADMTGSLVNTSNQVNSTAISASVDTSAKRAVAVLGDRNGYVGTANVTFSGLASVPALAINGRVNVVVDRIPDQSPLSAPAVVSNTNVSTSSGSITVPVTFVGSHDAFAVYLTPAGRSGAITGTGSSRCLDVPDASQALGIQTEIWDCNGQTNQTWHLTAAGELRTFNDSECLDADHAGTANGTKVLAYSCTGASNQHWSVNSDGSITNVASGKCLDVTGGATAAGALVELYTCTGAANQKWSIPNN